MNELSTTTEIATETLQTRQAWSSETSRIAAINAAIGENRLAKGGLYPCIAPLLIALDWFGSPRAFVTCLPPDSSDLSPESLRELLTTVGFSLERTSVREWQQAGCDISALRIGSILVSEGQPKVYLGYLDSQHWWHDGAGIISSDAISTADELFLITPDSDYQPIDEPQRSWLARLYGTAKKEVKGIFTVSLIINTLAIVISLFTMYVYNTIIPSGSAYSLWAMSIGVLMVVLISWFLRLSRGAILSRLSAWAGASIGLVSLRKTLGLPLDVSSRMGVENNLTRLRSIEGLRQWFGGSGGVASIDYPFVLIFLVTIALIGGWIVLVPVISLLIFAVSAWPMSAMVRNRSSKASKASKKLEEFVSTTIAHLRGLRGVSGSSFWKQRLAELISGAVNANRDYAKAAAFNQVYGQMLSSLTVLATMAVGIALVLARDMNAGGLIASMMLIRRITTPAQQIFASHVRFRQLFDAGNQLTRLLGSVGELSNPQVASPVDELTPAVELDRVFYRYNANREAALSGVSFKVEPGQIVSVVGPNGAGKTTLLEVLSGVRMSQNGRVLVGGRDIRQFDPTDYRSWHGYVPQAMIGLPISLRESLCLRCPGSSDDKMLEALELVAGKEWWRFFGCKSVEDGLNTSITPWREDQAALRGRFIVRMAAAVIDSPPLIIFDDPLGDRDPALDGFFLALLNRLRGNTTVIMATHRPDLIKVSDNIAVLNEGALMYYGPVEKPEESVISEESP